jgi:hypothetical protein
MTGGRDVGTAAWATRPAVVPGPLRRASILHGRRSGRRSPGTGPTTRATAGSRRAKRTDPQGDGSRMKEHWPPTLRSARRPFQGSTPCDAAPRASKTA